MSAEPLFLTLAEVLELHRRGIEQFGGSPEIRDMGLLESALAMPHAKFGGEFLHSSLAAMGAAYLFHLVSNHAFVDGNKRIGAAAARVFLLMNNAEFSPTQEQYGDLTRAVAAGSATKEQVTQFFEAHVLPR